MRISAATSVTRSWALGASLVARSMTIRTAKRTGWATKCQRRNDEKLTSFFAACRRVQSDINRTCSEYSAHRPKLPVNRDDECIGKVCRLFTFTWRGFKRKMCVKFRYIYGVPEDKVCTEYAKNEDITGDFIHIEQKQAARGAIDTWTTVCFKF